MASPSSPARMSSVAWAVLAVLLAAAAATAWHVTRAGEGFGIDSMFYLSQARTLVADGTLRIPSGYGGLTPLNHWPPFYPLVLALLHLAGLDALAAARWLNEVLFPLNVLLMLLLARRAGASIGAALVATFIFLCAPSVLEAHVFALSESLCLCTWLLSLWLLLRYRVTERNGWLIAAALVAAASVLTRYAAVAQVGAGVIYLLCHAPGKVSRRFTLAGVYAAIALAPLVIFGLWQHQVFAHADPAALHQSVFLDRHLHYYGLARAEIRGTEITLAGWLCPLASLPMVVRAPVMAGLVAGMLLAAWQGLGKGRESGNTAGAPGAALLVGANLAAYVALLAVVAVFYDPTLDLGARMHLPTFAFALILLAQLSSGLAQSPNLPVRRLAWAWAALAVLIYFAGAALWLRDADSHLDLASASWRNAPSVPRIQALRADAPVYSNDIKFIYYLTARTDLYTLPTAVSDTIRNTPNPNYSEEMAQLPTALLANHGTLVFFTAELPSLKRGPSLQDLKDNPALRLVAETPDALFFTAAATATRP